MVAGGDGPLPGGRTTKHHGGEQLVRRRPLATLLRRMRTHEHEGARPQGDLDSHALPRSPINDAVHWCPVWNIKGMCNGRCGNVADHGPHTKEQDADGYALARPAIPKANAPAVMVA